MKKLLAFLLFASMLCTLIPFAIVSVAAAGEPTVELVIETTEVDAGDEFEVTVNLLNLEDTDGLIAALVEIGFDTDAFEAVTYFDEDEEMWLPQIEIGSKYNASSKKYISYGQIYDDGTMKNCLVKYMRATASSTQVRREEYFCTITLKVKDDAASGTYDLNVIQMDGIYYGNEMFQFATINASITVNGSEPEHVCADVNKDHICDNGCTEPQGVHESNAPACVAGVCEYCGESVAATEDHHTYDETTHKCVCGAVEKFDILFSCNGGKYNGESFTYQSYEFGTVLNADDVAQYAGVKDGYTFNGFKDNEENWVEFPYTVTGSAVFYAQWTQNHVCSAATATKQNGQAATCTVDGWKDYYTCSCDKLFADADCTNEIADLAAWKTGAGKIAAGHTYGALIPGVDEIHTPDELKAAVAAHYFCDVCDKYFTDAKVETTLEALIGEAPQHAPQADDGDCTTDILCSCGKVMVKGNAAHTGGMATCVAKAKCSECGTEYGEVDPTKHAYGKSVTNWHQIGDDWYYGEYSVCAHNNEHVDHTPVTGLKRVPYNTELGHGALAEDLAYNPNFIDAESALYYFDSEGKYEITKNGIIDGKYVVNGMIPWHPGFVTVENELYYFVGDKENGGNKLADGFVNASRGIKAGRYYFRSGVLQKYTGIANIKGTLYFFNEDYTLAMGKGLVEIEEGKYIYVRSNGQLATGTYYTKDAKYEFDANGYSDGVKNGVIDGKYYENGHVAYGKGLVKWNGDIYYVRSNGEVATGKYYINVNKTNGIDLGTNKLFFGEDGKLLNVKNGIYEEDGKLYYYVGNRKACGAGLVEIEEGQYIYVRSTGEVQTGYFFITETNGIDGFTSGDKCLFGEDGKLVKNFGSEQK